MQLLPSIRFGLAGLAAGAAIAAEPAAAAGVIDPTAGIQRNLDMVWVLVAAGLVLLMQVGFMLLEAGMVRSKNAINVAQKNLLDFVFSVVVFAALGFMIAFGASHGLWFGFDSALLLLGDLDSWGLAFFIFQVMFCGTAATIVSGAVAERMRLTAYVMCSIVTAALIYPAIVHWAWGNALIDNASAFLAHNGFVDFAGSTVVHGTGAWIALAGCLTLGARRGRFAADGTPVRIQGHSPVLAASGALFLFVGWLGFNGGSTLSADTAVAAIIANTVLAAATGCAAGYALALLKGGAIRPEMAIAGLLGGLVAVTAGCHILDPRGAMIIGFVGGAAAIFGNALLERQFQIDDAVGAIGVHGFAGIVGTLGLALLAPLDSLPLASRMAQITAQAQGVAVTFAWAFGLGLGFFALLGTVIRLRAAEEDEERGLNAAEHSSQIGLGHVEEALGELVDGKADLSLRFDVAPGDDAERLTRLFNRLMDSIETAELQRSEEADEKRSAEEAERLSAFANATFEAIAISQDGVLIDGNAALERLLGAEIDEIRARSVLNFVDKANWPRLQKELRKPESGPYEIEVVHRDGSRIPVEVRARETLYRGEVTRISALVDLRDRKKAEEKIRHLAQHDPLTDLPNRAVFSDRLAAAMGKLSDGRGALAVLVIDLDRFKDINDLYGHPAGDAVIRIVAERLRSVLGAADTVARLGGDEFAIIHAEAEFTNQTADLAHRLLGLLSQPIECGDGIVVWTGASIGVALAPKHGSDAAAIISRADTALYKAKSLGRNRYCIFEDGMDADERARRAIEADLVTALERGEFELYFQPRMRVADIQTDGFEALIRWRHPRRGLVPPGEFIPVAEQSGRIVGIGAWVLSEACRIAKQNFDGCCRVSVNVSPLQFRDKDFVDTVKRALADSGLHPRSLELEITESVLIDDDARALSILKTLKAIGVRIALDDFGTGYSALGYLSRFPFDAIKIDRSFVRAMHATENALAIVATIVRLGRALGMDIVAEGVETVDELQLLVGAGCDEIQGYLVGRPAPIDSVQRSIPDHVVRALCEDPGETSHLVSQLQTMADRMRATDTTAARSEGGSRRPGSAKRKARRRSPQKRS